MRPTVIIDKKVFDSKLRKLQVIMKQDIGTLIKRFGRIFAVNLAKHTQPFGDSNAAQLVGQKAVVRDIRKVYSTGSGVFEDLKINAENIQTASLFWSALQDGKRRKAEKILRATHTKWRNVPISSFNESFHKSRRNRRGRVTGRVESQITSPSKIEAFIKRKIKLVGFAKSGWAACARQLGGIRGIPGFVTRNRGNGKVTDRTKSNSPHVELRNRVNYVSFACPESAQRAAVKDTLMNMDKEAEIKLQKSIAKAGLRGLR